ncbi:BRO-N domain-containing protein [Phocaeicola faecalis]
MNTASNQQATSLQIFDNPEIGARIRTTVERNETWFIAQDICNILNLRNSRKAIQSLDIDEKHDVTISYTPGGNQRVKAVNESGLYHLIFISRKPEARAFRKWVTNVVLPSIRRTGTYSSNGVQTPVEEPSKKLPLPKFRPFFAEWKEKVKPYIGADEVMTVAQNLKVSTSHVRKVYAGTSVSERVTRALNKEARFNYDNGRAYPEARPVYEQLSLEWEEQE